MSGKNMVGVAQTGSGKTLGVSFSFFIESINNNNIISLKFKYML